MSTITLNMTSAAKIIAQAGLDKDGATQKFLANEVKKACDPYVPFLTGPLKNTATVGTGYVHYTQVYARRQYYENTGGRNGALRGRQWDKRMWADRSEDITKSVAAYVKSRM
ncbi:MAG: minor capsid protein [Lachnospiraceae bacterium]|jgi:hypothetical protein|nr:minor capsid protein [Lachnospiraceae bacterium]